MTQPPPVLTEPPVLTLTYEQREALADAVLEYGGASRRAVRAYASPAVSASDVEREADAALAAVLDLLYPREGK